LVLWTGHGHKGLDPVVRTQVHDDERLLEDPMLLDLVGVDPDSPVEKCPSVHVDRETGEIYLQGKVVTDPLILARIAEHSPIGLDEAVLVYPPRMAPILAEAAAGTFETGRQGPGVPSFANLLSVTKRSAVHLEMRDAYALDDPAFVDWQATGSLEHPQADVWRKMVSEAVARGVRMRRLRVVSEPLTEYVRWEYELTDGLNIAAGEDVRWLPRRLAAGLMLPAHDYWMFDDRTVKWHNFTADGEDLGDTFTSDPATVAAAVMSLEAAWARAIPHEEYQPALK
jgi:hypothetical protein